MPTRKKLPKIQRLEFEEKEKEKEEQSQAQSQPLPLQTQSQAKPQEGREEQVEHRQGEEQSHEESQSTRPEVGSEESNREESSHEESEEEEVEEEIEKELNGEGESIQVSLGVSNRVVLEDVTTVTYLSHIFEVLKKGRFTVENGFLILYPEGNENTDININMVKIPIGEASTSVNAQLKATVRSLEDVKKLKELLKPLAPMRIRVVAELEV